MKMIKRYAGILMMLTLLVGFTSCESEEETEFNLPGEWYTNEEIDFGAYTWGRGTLMTFNARNQGTIGSAGDPNYLVFEWRWIDGGYNSMELHFYGDGTYAYIWGAEATVTALMPIFGVQKLPAGHLVEHGIIIGRILEIE